MNTYIELEGGPEDGQGRPLHIPEGDCVRLCVGDELYVGCEVDDGEGLWEILCVVSKVHYAVMWNVPTEDSAFHHFHVQAHDVIRVQMVTVKPKDDQLDESEPA